MYIYHDQFRVQFLEYYLITHTSFIWTKFKTKKISQIEWKWTLKLGWKFEQHDNT